MIDQAGIMMAQGHTIACERIAGVNDNMAKSHYHEYFELYYLEAGERYHMIQDRLYKIYPGEFLIFPPYMMHHSYGEKNVEFKRLLLYFSKKEVNALGLLRLLEEGNGVYKPDMRTKLVIHRMLETLLDEQEQKGTLTDVYSHTLLNMILLTIVRKISLPVKAEKRGRVEDVISYIHTHYQEDITLDSLAGQFYVSPYYLCREFKKYTNSTIIQYLNVTRIMNAQRKFMETDGNITQISKATGFSNITHFNRVFKAVTGMTPSSYRKLLQTAEAGTNTGSDPKE